MKLDGLTEAYIQVNESKEDSKAIQKKLQEIYAICSKYKKIAGANPYAMTLKHLEDVFNMWGV
jgi:hypothetical protein